MADSVYRVTEVVGVSSDSWEQATKSAIEKVGASVRDLRIAGGDPPGCDNQRREGLRVPDQARDLVQVRGRLAS